MDALDQHKSVDDDRFLLPYLPAYTLPLPSCCAAARAPLARARLSSATAHLLLCLSRAWRRQHGRTRASCCPGLTVRGQRHLLRCACRLTMPPPTQRRNAHPMAFTTLPSRAHTPYDAPYHAHARRALQRPYASSVTFLASRLVANTLRPTFALPPAPRLTPSCHGLPAPVCCTALVPHRFSTTFVVAKLNMDELRPLPHCPGRWTGRLCAALSFALLLRHLLLHYSCALHYTATRASPA